MSARFMGAVIWEGDNVFGGKQLRYLIGGDDSAQGKEDEITELGFDAEEPPKHGIGIKYCNLFDEKYDARRRPATTDLISAAPTSPENTRGADRPGRRRLEQESE